MRTKNMNMVLNCSMEDGEIFNPVSSSTPKRPGITGTGANANGMINRRPWTRSMSKSLMNESILLSISPTLLPISPKEQLHYRHKPVKVIKPKSGTGNGLRRSLRLSLNRIRKSIQFTPISCKTKTLKRLQTPKKTIKRKNLNTPTPKRKSISKKYKHERRFTPKYKTKPKKNYGKPRPRPIVVDGSNVAASYGAKMGRYVNGKAEFMPEGIKKWVEYLKYDRPFKYNRHEIIVFVPRWRLTSAKWEDKKILEKLLEKGILELTPSGTVGSQRYASYDDNFIVEYAYKEGGIIVSNDKYRDVEEKNPKWSSTIQKRRVEFQWVGTRKPRFMMPQDPTGRLGPKLSELILF